MAKFIQAPTTVCNFTEALKFMKERMDYYENELGEPSDWECMVNFDDDNLWIKQIGDNFFDTMLESDQTGGCRITTPMNLEELKIYVGEHSYHKNVEPFKYICGPYYEGL